MLEEEYNHKLESLRKYVPFLINMMTELKAKGNREAQLNKIQSLHDMITSSNKKLKLETLNRCEEVLNNIYFKVNPQLRLKGLDSPQICPKLDSPKPDIPEIESPSSTPASPSPPPTILRTKPVTIPTEKVTNDSASSSPSFSLTTSHLPKVNVYSNVVLNNPTQILKPTLVDMSKPPISLDDLKTLEEDVHQKLKDRPSETASVKEPNADRKPANSALAQHSPEAKLLSSKAYSCAKNIAVKLLKESESILESIDEKLCEEKSKKSRHSISSSKDAEPYPSKSDFCGEKKDEPDKTAVVYKRLADKYHPKPRQKPVGSSAADAEKDTNSPIPTVTLQNRAMKPDDVVIRRGPAVAPVKPFPEPPKLLQLLSPSSHLPGAPSPGFNPSPRPSPEMAFEPLSHLRDPVVMHYPASQMYHPQTQTHYPMDWNNTYYGSNPALEQKMYTEGQWNESHRRWGLRPGDPRSYKEYKEMKEREARASMDKSKEAKDPRLTARENKETVAESKTQSNPILSKESISRDPRLARFRDKSKESYSKDTVAYEHKPKSAVPVSDSKFDKMYSSTNRGRTFRTDKNQVDDSFISPLDSLYAVGRDQRTGRGYGVQKFKIPKRSKSSKPRRLKIDDSSEEEAEAVLTVEHGDRSDEENDEKEAAVSSPAPKEPNCKATIVVYLNESGVESKKTNVEDSWAGCCRDDGEFVSEYDKENEQSKELEQIAPEDAEPTNRSTDESLSQSETSEQNREVEEESTYISKTNSDGKADSVNSTEPPDQKILAHFFENLLKSKDKKEKKTALFSLIETFSDSFDEKEIQKIRNIISDQEGVEGLKDQASKDCNDDIPEVGSTTDDLPEAAEIVPTINADADAHVDSSENLQIQDDQPGSSSLESVQESVGERIKNRKRSVKPRKKLRSELDMLHDDIQEMFIRDGVLTANGKRMCRILKDDPNALEKDKRNAKSKSNVKVKSKPAKEEVKETVRDVRIVLNKIPDDVMHASMRQLRDRRRTTSYVESDEEEIDVDDSSSRVDIESDGEDKRENTDNDVRCTRKKSRRGLWALGIIPKTKHRKSTDKCSQKPDVVEPDKSYYYDYDERKKLSCLFCSYSGLLLTTHYLREHPTSEVHCSRLSPQQAASAVSDYTANRGKYMNIIKKISGKYNYTCRRCHYSTVTIPVFFYEHVTTHTGEYRHRCNACPNFSCATRKTLMAHFMTAHPGELKDFSQASCPAPVIFAYLCGQCNYFQLSEDKVSKHISTFHRNTNPQIFKISMSEVLDPALVSTDYIDTDQLNSDETQTIYKKPGPKSKTMPIAIEKGPDSENKSSAQADKVAVEISDVSTMERNENSEVSSEKFDTEIEEHSPIKKKPGPKSRTLSVIPSKKYNKDDDNLDHTKNIRTSGRIKRRCTKSIDGDKPIDANVAEEKLQDSEPAPSFKINETFKDTPNRKRRRSLENLIPEDGKEDLDSIITLSSRSNRAAKEKATAKLKTLMENHEYPSLERTSEVDKLTNPPSVPSPSAKERDVKFVESLKEPEKISENSSEYPKDNTIEVENKAGDCAQNSDVKKPDLNVFTCKTDIMEEDAKLIEKERLRKMDELTKSIGSRQSKLDFVDKLCDRLNSEKNDSHVLDCAVVIKSERINESTLPIQEPSTSTPAVKICADSPKNLCKKPVLDEEILPKPNIEFNQNKSVALFSNTIEKLQGKVNEAAEQEANTHATSDESTLVIGDIMKVVKKDDTIVYTCLVDQCYVCTVDKIVFQLHCKFGHTHHNYKSTLCEICNISLNATKGNTLLENTFDHLMLAHSDFIGIQQNSKKSRVRMRKLSGDKLSIKAEKDPVENMVTLESTEENPFSFKIVDVMSLAETSQAPTAKLSPVKPVPPLTPILQKQSPVQLLVKEAKLTVSELSRPRKAQKALCKFIECPGELYKCPHLYCMFGTNVRTFFERHIKIHEGSGDSMIPCVYCDIKTPWEHVPLHIDIRHAHCQYACRYCLYRAISTEYVCVHQHQNHQGQEFVVMHLPQHKVAKKYSVTDLKFDHKTLCEPFRCGCKMDKEYLFENEFKKHLTEVHGDSKVPCGFPKCVYRVNSFLMLNHWSAFHGLSTYQCGYCKTSGKEESKMYTHFVKFHPSLQPHLLVRNCSDLPDDEELGCSEEAFQRMKHIRTFPSLSTILGKKFSTNNVKVLKISSTFQSSSSISNQNTPLMLKPIVPRQGPSTKILISNPNVKLLVTSSSEKLYLVPTSSISSPKFITSVAPINKVTVETSSASETILGHVGEDNISKLTDKYKDVRTEENATTEKNTALVENTITDNVSQNTSVSGPPPLIYITDKVSPITPVEHIVLPETSTDDVNLLPEDLDPLILDHSVEGATDNFHAGSNSIVEDPLNICTLSNALGDPLNIEPTVSLAEHSERSNKILEEVAHSTFSTSDEDTDSKSKHSGLSGLQLYRCAVCNQSFSIIPALKHHLVTSSNCKKPGLKPYQCFHCSKMVKTLSVLLDHLQTHGVQRFICSLCNEKFSTLAAVRSHNKSRHCIHHTTLVPLDNSKTDVETDIFIVKPTLLNITSNKDTENSWEYSSGSSTEQVFLPDEIEKIPIRQIFNTNVKCGLCNYQTKVRVNIVRHLQMHSEEKSVPDTAPVNPVPCLEKNEKMFDKMINLAASSITGRMGVNKINEKEEEKYPEFVPTHCRFVCCASSCSYLCPEEANLKHHLMALHSDDTNFTCAHCKHAISPTDAESVIKHFKLHGLHLYKCQHCKFLHHLKHKVEKHIVDNHLDATVKVVTLRYMESEPVEGREIEESQSVTPNKQKPWRCCMCKAKYSTRQHIQAHIIYKHDVDAQYKCTLCAFKNDEADSFKNHFAQHHPGHKIDIIFVYQKFEEEAPKDENFDTTPLWQRDKPRIRHIRGILFDEASPQPSKVSKKNPKSAAKTQICNPIKNLADCIEAVATGTGRIINSEMKAEDTTHSVSTELQNIESGKKVDKQFDEDDDVKHIKIDAPVIVIDDSDEEIKPLINSKHADKNWNRQNSSLVSQKVPKSECEDKKNLASMYSKEHLISLYGNFGSPHKKQWRCPKCHQFKSRRVADFIYHIYKDFNAYRFKCRICHDLSITYKYMLDHLKQHPGKCDDVIESLPADIKLETWIHMVIREQTIAILKNSPATENLSSTNEDGIKCFFCDDKFQNMGECCEHMLNHWAVMPYRCDECNAEFYNVVGLREHYKITHPGIPLFLEPKGPTLQVAIKCCESVYKRHSEMPYCHIPNKKPKLEESEVIKKTVLDTVPTINLDDDIPKAKKNHLDDLKVNDYQIFACDICPWTGNTGPLVLEHLKENHSVYNSRYHIINKMVSADNLICNICKKSLPELELRQHFLEEHCDETFAPYRHECTMCNKKYLVAGRLKAHLTMFHGMIGPVADNRLIYKCTVCSYMSVGRNNSSIKIHMRGHLPPVMCLLCTKRFKSENMAVNHHRRVHPGQEVNITRLPEVQQEYQKAMQLINKNAVKVSSSAANSSETSSMQLSHKGHEELESECNDTSIDLNMSVDDAGEIMSDNKESKSD